MADINIFSSCNINEHLLTVLLENVNQILWLYVSIVSGAHLLSSWVTEFKSFGCNTF